MANPITPEWLDQKISGVVIDMSSSVKGKNTGKKDDEGKPIPEFEPVKVSLKLDYTGMTLREVFVKAASAHVVNWANKMRPQGEDAVKNKSNWKVVCKEFFAAKIIGTGKSIDTQIGEMSLEQLAEIEAKIAAQKKALESK